MAVDALLHENEALRRELAERDDRLAEREERIARLESQLDALAQKLKLTARERQLLEQKLKQLLALRRRHPLLAEGQGVLDFGGTPVAAGAEEQPAHVGEAPDGETPEDPIRQRHKPKKPAKKLDTSNLPVEHAYHELTSEERHCALTGKTLVPVGEKIDEEIEFQPGFLKLVLHHRTVYGLSEEDARERKVALATAPGPTRPVEGSIAGANLLAWILLQKYGRHLPLYRQEEILAQHGLRMPRQTTCDWVLASAQQLSPIQEALRRSILATKLVQTDGSCGRRTRSWRRKWPAASSATATTRSVPVTWPAVSPWRRAVRGRARPAFSAKGWTGWWLTRPPASRIRSGTSTSRSGWSRSAAGHCS